MSNYTSSLYKCLYALNNYTEEEELFSGFHGVEDNIRLARSKVFDFSYPFYSNNAILKQNFEQKFLRHFYTREIGSETFGLFQLRLKQKFDVIMPYYRDIFNTIIDYDLFTQLGEKEIIGELGSFTASGSGSSSGTNTGTQTTSGTDTGTIGIKGSNTGTVKNVGSNTGTVTDSGSNTGTQRNISTKEDKLRFLDTPQGDINLLTDGSGGGSGDTSSYLTNANWNNYNEDATRTDNLQNSNTRTDNLSNENTRTDNLSNSSTQTNNLSSSSTRTDNLSNSSSSQSSNSGSDTRNITKEYIGNKGKTKTELIQEFRKAIINIDDSIFNECNDLFMLIY